MMETETPIGSGESIEGSAANGGPPGEVPALGQSSLFLPDEYEVKQLSATLGGITVDISESALQGLQIGDTTDILIRNVKVVSAKPTHKGDVTLVLHGDNLNRA